jgi:hypothetical protein
MKAEDWISVSERLPKRGVKVRCLLASHIGPNTNEKNLYRMKYNGKWNDYPHLVTHWKPIESAP